jgi:hypothetical protein
MKKIALLSIIPMIALGASAHAACDTTLTEKTWDKTASGYCKIFFPDCTQERLGTRMSYERSVSPEIICIGEKGAYRDYYAVTINDANQVFGTAFSKIGANYTGELSGWLYENCAKYCGEISAVKIEVAESVKIDDADDAPEAAETDAPAAPAAVDESTAE